MGIELRHGNKLYYYRKRRVGDRVISEYAGAGAIADIEEYKAKQLAAKKEAERRSLEAAQQLTAEIDSQIAPVADLIDLMVKAYLITEGFYTHKGQWRKARV